MSLFFADLVRVACHATGAGDLVLGAALPGHRGFDAVPAGARFHYAVLGVTHPEEWETGEGEIGGGGTLLRLPLASSAAGAAVDFSPGLKTVSLTVAAAWFAAREAEAAADPPGIDDIEGLQAALDGKAALAGAAFTGAISASALSLADDLAVADGGTGASSASAARTNLGLGSIATQNASAVAISGGTVSGLSSLGVAGAISASALSLADDLAVADGGTGASSASAARTNLGLGSIATQNASAVAIGGGTIGGLSSLGVAGNADISGTYRVNGVQVTGARRTGWSAPGGTASRASFETGVVTVVQLAQRVKALIDDLTAHGLIGS